VTRFLFSVVVAGSLAVGVACNKAPAASTSTAAPPKADAAKAPAASDASATPTTPPWADPKKPVPAELPDVLARVNGENVTKADFDRLIKNIEQSNGKPVPPERRDEILRKALDDLITLTVLSQEAKTRNVAVSDADIDANLAELRKSFRGNDQQFQQALAARGMTSEQMRTDAGVQLRVNKMVQTEVSTVAGASEAEAREFYDKNPDRFKPEEVRASHILVAVKEDAKEGEVAQARARAESVLKQAKAGTDFATLARRYSDDSSKSQGGDLGFFPHGKLPPEFEQVAFSLKAGQMSDVVATPFGFHIIKVADRRVAPTMPFEQVSPQIREMLFTQRKEQKAQAFIESVKKKAKIEVLI
jgi:parvulin-like peptidyl-prolyl isomerase